MNINPEKILLDFVFHNAGEIIITDSEHNILYRNNAMDFGSDKFRKWAFLYAEEEIPETGFSHEISDKETGRYYRVNVFPAEYEGERIYIHHFEDVGEYAEMIRDVSGYSKSWKNISSFQDAVLKNISGKYTDCLPISVKYFETDTAVLLIARKNYTEKYVMSKKTGGTACEKIAGTPDFMQDISSVGSCSSVSFDGMELICCCAGRTVSGIGYALLISEEKKGMRIQYNTLRLFIENSLLREQLIYEYEHDKLTGLYNKGKYIEMSRKFFPNCKTIAYYNMDLNFLKRTNDRYGHDHGDRLIIRAADSLRVLETENICGFRTGGDEFILVSWDITEQEAEALFEKWKNTLEEQNKSYEYECVIACGFCYASGEFDFDSVVEISEKRMYENKVAIKTARGEDPNSR